MLRFLFGIIILPFFPAVAFAQEQALLDCNDPKNAALSTCAAAGLNISNSLATIIQFLFVIAVVLALGFLVYGGIKWITSGGDKGGVEAARNMIVASIIGLILVFLAYVVINLVLTFLTGKGIGGITIPNLTRDSLSNEEALDTMRSTRFGLPVTRTGQEPCGSGGEEACEYTLSNGTKLYRCDGFPDLEMEQGEVC